MSSVVGNPSAQRADQMGGLLRAGRERRTPSVKNTVGYVTTVIAALRDPDVDRLGPVRSAVGERIETQDWDAIARGVTLVYYDPSPSSSPDQPAPTPAYLARPITIARPGLNRADGVSISVLTYTGGACDFTALITVVRENLSRAAIRTFGAPLRGNLLINTQSSKVITLRSLASTHLSPATVQFSSSVEMNLADETVGIDWPIPLLDIALAEGRCSAAR